jgi:NAD(P)H-dependent FMN reductase
MGSPRKGGNADLLLDQALAGAREAGAETEKLLAADLKVAPCLACRGCERTGVCVVHDTMTEVYPKLSGAQAIIVSSPIFFMGLPAQLKALIDRCQPFWVRKYLLHKPIYMSDRPDEADKSEDGSNRRGLFIAVGATNLPRTFDAVRFEVQSFFHCIEVTYADELFFPDVEEHGAIAHVPEALGKAFRAGEKLVRTP